VAAAAFNARLLLRLWCGKTREGISAAVKCKAETLRDTAWRENYGRLFADNPTAAEIHADIVAMNRSLNPL
jgi:hypothetical protein